MPDSTNDSVYNNISPRRSARVTMGNPPKIWRSSFILRGGDVMKRVLHNGQLIDLIKHCNASRSVTRRVINFDVVFPRAQPSLSELTFLCRSSCYLICTIIITLLNNRLYVYILSVFLVCLSLINGIRSSIV